MITLTSIQQTLLECVITHKDSIKAEKTLIDAELKIADTKKRSGLTAADLRVKTATDAIGESTAKVESFTQKLRDSGLTNEQIVEAEGQVRATMSPTMTAGLRSPALSSTSSSTSGSPRSGVYGKLRNLFKSNSYESVTDASAAPNHAKRVSH